MEDLQCALRVFAKVRLEFAPVQNEEGLVTWLACQSTGAEPLEDLLCA
jgi:hypothetical protein